MNCKEDMVYCLCGELMKKEDIGKYLPVCWKCQCDTDEEIEQEKL